jgi:hypothetical protein
VQELQDKARLFEKYGIVPVLDVTSTVVKSDSAVPATLKQALRKAVERLENVPDNQKDWHPGSDGKVLDLVHPSLYPFVYGRSRILPDKTVDRDNCIQNIGNGETVIDPLIKVSNDFYGLRQANLYSKKFQWLPCNVSFPDGENAKIESYINNLHPQDYADMYEVIEQLITKAVPLWNLVLSDDPPPGLRIECDRIEGEWPEDVWEGRSIYSNDSDYSDLDEYDENDQPEIERRNQIKREQREEYIVQNRMMQKPEPGAYEETVYTDARINDRWSSLAVSDENDLKPKKNLQIIVKLATIHLTPSNPEYDGGSWHIEGQLNEHIVATALYYYDNDNVTDSHLAFRTKIDGEFIYDVRYEQQDWDGIFCIYGFKNWERNVQDLGSVLTREDRMVVFPNVFQHRVGKFRLADPSKPGHRKIVALFLVDPHIPIISTANVPPQQRDWWLREVEGQCGRIGGLPRELVDLIGSQVDEFPIGVEEARELRVELMEERRGIDVDVEEAMADYEFNFCEH